MDFELLVVGLRLVAVVLAVVCGANMSGNVGFARGQSHLQELSHLC